MLFPIIVIIKTAEINILVYATFHILFLKIGTFLELLNIQRVFDIYSQNILRKGIQELIYNLGVGKGFFIIMQNLGLIKVDKFKWQKTPAAKEKSK